MPPPNEDNVVSAAWIELPDQSTFPLNGDCHFGRTEGNEIINPDTRISRRHAVIQRQGQRFVLVDLGSTNGTYLNDTRIFTARKLRDGDVILLGSLRYTFRQPGLSGASSVGESTQHTVVAVGKIACWMILVAGPLPDSTPIVAWKEKIRQALAAAGASLRSVRGTTIFGHWREGRISPQKFGLLLTELSRLPPPPGARLVVHHGAVRVGPGAAPGEENLVGSEVTFAHKLDGIAEVAGIPLAVSEAAAHALGTTLSLTPIGAPTLRAAGPVPPLFTIG
ncbi:MAG TPA: FHA domain-containing protein [Candidatus Didemnitutus sp.]|nr:FHA domain-containing protein [Candidatus Didemnitutus sp.]